MQFLLLVNRQGKTRLAAFYNSVSQCDRQNIIKEVTQIVLSRSAKLCNVVEWREEKLIYKRYASLYFIAGIQKKENELLTLEVIHHYVELLDRYFGNVCELDIIFNFHKAHYILNEFIVAGELHENNKKTILRLISSQDCLTSNSIESIHSCKSDA